MPIAWSNLPIIDTLIDGTSQTGIRDGIDAAVLSAGWTVDRSITNGKVYRLISPQGLAARCQVQYLGTSWVGKPVVLVTFMSDDETKVGRAFPLLAVDDREYRVNVGICQLFISQPGYTDDSDTLGGWGHSLAGGIPHIAEGELGVELEGECAVEVNEDLTLQAFWSCGQALSGLQSQQEHFRYSYRTGLVNFACLRNDDLCLGPFLGYEPRLRVLPLTHTDVDSGLPSWGFTHWAADIYQELMEGEPLYLDPFVAWGTAAGGPAQLRGQLYDAMLASKHRPLDHELETTEPTEDGGTIQVTWRNYMHYKGSLATGSPFSYHAGLYLCTGIPLGPGESNYVY
jgi:hypothetical protein